MIVFYVLFITNSVNLYYFKCMHGVVRHTAIIARDIRQLGHRRTPWIQICKDLIRKGYFGLEFFVNQILKYSPTILLDVVKAG